MKSIKWLRISLGLIFFWFGLLKVVGVSPVFEIVNATFPFLATPEGLIILGVVEVLIGIALLFNIVSRLASCVLIFHLFGTLLSFVLAPDLLFFPSFPALSLLGEFVIKNIVLVTGAFVVIQEQKIK